MDIINSGQQTKDIIKRVQKLNDHILKYDVYMSKLGNSLGTTVNTYNTAYKEFQKIDKDVVKIGGADRELIEGVEVDKPQLEG